MAGELPVKCPGGPAPFSSVCLGLMKTTLVFSPILYRSVKFPEETDHIPCK